MPVMQLMGVGCAPTPCVAVHVERTQVRRFSSRLQQLQVDASPAIGVTVVAEQSPIVYAKCANGSFDANASLFQAVSSEMAGSDDRIAAHRVYRLDWSCGEAHWVPMAAEMRARKSTDVFRVVAFPRRLQQQLTAMLADQGFQVHPTSFTAELHAVSQPELAPFVHFGVVDRGEDSSRVVDDEGEGEGNTDRLPLTAGQAPSRAYFKMQESVRQHLRALQPGFHAIDIGASPGGWTDCLVANGAGLVVAVDPGELTISKSNRPIVHVQALLDDALDDIRAIQKRQNPARLFDLCVCDINMRVELMAKIVLGAAELVAPRGQLVCTLKLGRKPTDSAVERAVSTVTSTLSPAFEGFRVTWLHANTQNERTLFGTRKTC